MMEYAQWMQELATGELLVEEKTDRPKTDSPYVEPLDAIPVAEYSTKGAINELV